ncbi:MAG: hypothetical protein R3C14_07255 [Caldilineaceae bacterium]
MHAVLDELFPYLLLLYLIDSVALLNVGQVFFVTQWGYAWCVNTWPGFVINPWPLGQTIVTRGLTALPTRTGLYTFVQGRGHFDAQYQLDDFHFIAYAEVDGLEVDGATVIFNPKMRLTAASPRRAQQLVELLQSLRRAPVEARATPIRHYLAQNTDLASIRKRYAAAVEAASVLQILSLLLVLNVFVLLPLALYGQALVVLALPRVLILIAVTYVLCLAATLYYHRILHETTWLAAVSEQLGLFFSPVSAMRALDHVTRKLYADFEAVAVAAVLLPAADFGRLLRQELHHAQCAQQLMTCTEWVEFWVERQARLAAMGQEAGFTLDQIYAQPLRQDQGAANYCPICHSEFRANFTWCPDCQTTLQSFGV